MMGALQYRAVIRRLAAFLALVALAFPLSARAAVVPPSAAAMLAEVEMLAAPAMDGRASGTDGGLRAARHIAEVFRAAGLRPGGDDGSYLESFTVATGMRLATTGHGNTLEDVAGDRKSFEVGRDWIPHGGAAEDDVTGELVFAGYGVVAPAEGYDDYGGLDVRGRIVMVLAGAPDHLSPARWSRLDKLVAARERGAAALLLVDEALPPLDATATRVKLPSATVTPPTADALLAPSGRTIASARAAIRTARAPRSFAAGTTARLAITLAPDARRGVNVIGVLPGTDPALADDAIVLGAHYDHLGRRGDTLYPGADDNASGTALVVTLARAFAAGGGEARTLVFALFGGEELGLLGSRHHVGRPARGRTVAMLNFDMIGRLRDGPLHVSGVDTAADWRPVLAAAAHGAGVDVTMRGTPFAASDHVQFYRSGVPVLFFTTGTHEDYHRPSDTPDKIDATGLARIGTLATRVVERLAAGRAPRYVKLDPPAERRATAPATGAFFGIASAGAGGDGVRVSEVVAGTAAARLGLASGDVIIRFDGAAVTTFQELRERLKARRPGDRVSVVYLRDGEPRTGAETLGATP
jgi:hypothetical protein